MGELHLEVLGERMRREFKVGAQMGKPQVAYRETITQAVKSEGRFVRQVGGHGQYGHVWVEFQPAERGAGFTFIDAVKGGTIPRQYINPVQAGIREAMESGGTTGYPIVDVEATLVDGSYHEVDSSDLAFKMAGSLALRSALGRAESSLLEPVMKLEVVTPEEVVGEIIGDLSARRGQVEGMEAFGNTRVVRCLVPLAETFGYATDLRSLSRGRATYSMEFHRYEPVPKGLVQSVVAGA
jgi:elongation factor G